MAIDKSRARAFISRWEAEVPHLYRDSVGWATIACGNKVSLGGFLGLPMVAANDGAEASASVKGWEYEAVMAAHPGRVAGWYRQFTKLILPAPQIGILFEQRVDEFEAQLRHLFTGYDGFPDDAQLGLLDMIFNLGAGTLGTFTHLLAAVRAGDWSAAAEACHRARPAGQTPPTPPARDFHEERQAAVKMLFLSAAVAP